MNHIYQADQNSSAPLAVRVGADMFAQSVVQQIMRDAYADVTTPQPERRQGGFRRLIVERLVPLFEDNTFGPAVLSRRMLPGVLMAINLILGPRCRARFDRRAEDVADDTSAQAQLVFDILGEVAASFSAYEQRSSWFINMVNGNIAPRSQTPEQAMEDAEMNGDDLRLILRTLFADLWEQLRPSEDKATLDHSDPEKCAAVMLALRNIWSADH